MNKQYKLFGIPSSLYTGKVRSYLRKQHIAFVEYGVNDPHYQQHIVPAVGRMIMPVVETPEGVLLQDGADIIDFIERENRTRLPAVPESSLLASISYLFELFGGEGLLRPAMHYRWSFDEQHLDFIKNDFCAALVPPDTDQASRDALFDFASKKMRGVARGFGVNKDTGDLIEASYKEFLGLFSAHLKSQPYLLGGSPCMGDYGLVAALYAHLSRDPVPSMVTRQYAPEVSRWVERMHSPESIRVEYADNSEALISEEPIPQTLKALMHFIADDFLPELEAHVSFANDWLQQHSDLKTGTNGMDDPAARVIGKVEFEWRGTVLRTAVYPYRFYLLQRIQDCVEKASEAEQKNIRALFSEVGLAFVLTLKTDRRVERVNHLEVWGDLRLDLT